MRSLQKAKNTVNERVSLKIPLCFMAEADGLEAVTTRLIEGPPASGTTVIEERRSETEHISRPGTVIDEHRSEFAEEVRTKPLSEAPRSVREWDGLSKIRSISPKSSVSHRSRRSHSHADRSRRSTSSSSSTEVFEEKKTIIEERSSSPARTHRSHRSHRSRGTSFSGTEIIERKKIIEEDVGIADESNSVAFGPLALVEQASRERTDEEIKRDIRRLERERRDLRRERSRGAEVVRIERGRRDSSPLLLEPAARGEIIIERRGDELVEVRKDRRGKMSLVV